MKIAGQKNAGAWYRFNKWMKNQSGAVQAKWKADNDLVSAATDLMEVMESLAGDMIGMGIADFGGPANPTELLQGWVDNGIPLQVWMGKLSLDNYTHVEDGATIPDTSPARTNNTGVAQYYPNHPNTMARIGKEVRFAAKRIKKAARQITDLANTISNPHQNPGGIANAERDGIG